MKTIEKKLLVGGLVVVVVATIFMMSAPASDADDNTWTLPIPYGENLTLWELITSPYTHFLGAMFYQIMICLVAGLIWTKVQNIGPALWWLIIANVALGVFGTGLTTMFYWAIAVVGITALLYRAFVR